MNYDEFKKLCADLAGKQNVEMSEADTIGKLICPFLEKMGYSEENLVREASTYAGRIDLKVCVGKKNLFAVEAKANGKKLNETHESQLKAYMCTSGLDLGMLSNGSEYRFFIRTAKGEAGIHLFFKFNLETPNATAWVLFSIIGRFSFTKSKIDGFMAVSDDLRAILDGYVEEKTKIVTTDDEKAAFNFICGLLSGVFDVSRLFPNDTVNYFSIILDGHKKQTLCRIRFDRTPHVIQFYDRENNGEKKRDSRGLPTVFKDRPFSEIREIAAYKKDFEEELKRLCAEPNS